MKNWSALPERFEGRTLRVATQHGKEGVIGPALSTVLPLAGYKAIPNVDTDRFGAFSGEVQRIHDPFTTAIAKAKHGAEVCGMDLVIASEGSFGPYPLSPFVSCNEEILVLYDALDGAVFEHKFLSLDTVFGGEACTSLAQVRAFAQRMKFPEHGMVVRTKAKWERGHRQEKGIHDEGRLIAEAGELLSAQGTVWVETDMRAMCNPTRMKVIGETAQRFAKELACTCPQCGHFFFRITGAQSGLPCDLCGWPTESIRCFTRQCRSCGHSEEEARPDCKRVEQPQFCANCNP